VPYSVRKAKCKQTDGDRGGFVLSYTDNKGKRHRNCHTSRKKARAQISAIEMPEGIDDIDESWVPLASRITQLLEEELAHLAGSFRANESVKKHDLMKGDRIRPSKISSEMMVHTMGKVPHGTIIADNGDGTYDVEWDPMPAPPSYRGDDEVDDEPEETVERRVPARNLKRAKPGT
jgi:hypothetical protein